MVLRHYMEAWLPIMLSSNERVLFIDAFAGPGRYMVGVLVVVAGVHRKGHHRRFGRGSSSGAMGRAFVMVLNCSISSW